MEPGPNTTNKIGKNVRKRAWPRGTQFLHWYVKGESIVKLVIVNVHVSWYFWPQDGAAGIF